MEAIQFARIFHGELQHTDNVIEALWNAIAIAEKEEPAQKFDPLAGRAETVGNG